MLFIFVPDFNYQTKININEINYVSGKSLECTETCKCSGFGYSYEEKEKNLQQGQLRGKLLLSSLRKMFLIKL